MNELQELRKSIDLIDKELIGILAKRMRVVSEIGWYKKQHNIQTLDKNRWQEVVLNIVRAAKKLKLNQKLVEDIYTLIHKNSLEIEDKK